METASMYRARELLAPSRLEAGDGLILVSNRGPLEHSFDQRGSLQTHQAGGGVAVALGGIASGERVSWLSSCSSPADIFAARRQPQIGFGERATLRMLPVDPKAYQAFYASFSNPILWFIQHGLADRLAPGVLAESRRSWSQGYVAVNRLFADAVIEEMDRLGTSSAMLHDYHFYLCGRMIRQKRPDASLQHFTHIPWPRPEDWRYLPEGMVADICRGLLANDSVVFQTAESVENFLDTCRAYLRDDAEVCSREGLVTCDGWTTRVWASPISVDVADLIELRDRPEVQQWDGGTAHDADEQLIVRVDRLDPSKNALRGFQAFEAMLSKNHGLHGEVRFAAYLVPSRESMQVYRDYAAEVLQLTERINRRFGDDKWQPVQVILGQDRARAIAGLCNYDVLLVNPLADGMNLVAKEGPILNRRDGVLVLSRTAGAYGELAGDALGIDPLDVASTADAMERAVRMNSGERQRRASALQRHIASHQLDDWFAALREDLAITDYLKQGAMIRTA